MQSNDQKNAGVEQNGELYCPDCDKAWEFFNINEKIPRKVDAAIHYVEKHGDKIPNNAKFGDYQCPNCLDILGLNGTASCSKCGHVPKEAVLHE